MPMQGIFAEIETIADLESFIKRDPSLFSLREYVERSLAGDHSHDIGHALRVALWTLRLGGSEVIPREAIAAALCHDLVHVPKNSPERTEASNLSAKAASQILSEYGFGSASVSLIAEAIRDHSYSRGAVPCSRLGQALQDADRLEALGAIGIMRTISTGVTMGAQYFDPDDPWATTRLLNDQRFSVDHFFTKLFRLSSSMCTLEGRLEAERRMQVMRSFLDALAEEIGLPRPRSID